MRFVGLLAIVCLRRFTSAAITLDFNVNGEDATNCVFRFEDVTTTSVTGLEDKAQTFTLAESSQGLSGATGSLTVSLIGKDRSHGGENAAKWSFGPDAIIHSNRLGLGVQSAGENGAQSRLDRKEAVILSFNVSKLDILDPGSSLVFSILSRGGDTYRIFQRTGSRAGKEQFSMSRTRSAKFSDPLPLTSGHAAASGIYEFAIVDVGWDGGSALRLKSLSVDVLKNYADITPVPTSRTSEDETVVSPSPTPAATEVETSGSPAPTSDSITLSSDTEIILNFDRDGDESTEKTFKFTNLGSSTPVVNEVGASFPCFSVSPSSGDLVGVNGSIAVTWTGKDGINVTDDAEQWAFGPSAAIISHADGLGVCSSNETVGCQQLGSGEAFILAFDTNKLQLFPGSQLAFTVLSKAGETYRIFQRTGLHSGKEVFARTDSLQAVPSDLILVTSGYESSTGVYEFAIVHAGWDGGDRLQITRFSLGITGAPLLSNYEPLRLHPIFTNNLMLQRDADVKIYGTATVGFDISVTIEDTQTKTTTVGVDGNWSVVLDPMSASYTSRTVLITDGVQSLSLSNMLVGDVWLCSGQSNMDRGFQLYNSLNTSGLQNPFIRLVQVARGGPKSPSDNLTLTSDLNGSWQECTSSFLEPFSPAAYFFGARMEANNSVPIGLMHVAMGATSIEQWTSAEVLISLGINPSANDSWTRNYNGMIYPLRKFAFKGVLWYQGESNAQNPAAYAQLFPAMINSWRNIFGRGDIPFYFAQLATHGARLWDLTDTAKPFLREAQLSGLSLPNTKMIALMDAGEYLSIHPENKMAVGERFARHALTAEGHTAINTNSPVFKSMKLHRDRVVVTFDNVGIGLETREVKLNYNEGLAQGTDKQAFVAPADELLGFTICGSNGVFVNATATITASNEATVWSEHVPDPIAVRYCFQWFNLCNLYASNDGWAATPFRTDKFPIPNFVGNSTGELFDGDWDRLGDPMNISLTFGPSMIAPVTVAGVGGYQVVGATERLLYFTTTNPYFQNGPEPYVVIRILYYDQGSDRINVRYDSVGGLSAIAPLQIIPRSTMTWRVASVVLFDALFNKNLFGYDLRLQCSSSDMIIAGVFLSGSSAVTAQASK